MEEIEYIKLDENLDAPVTRRDLQTLLDKLHSLYQQEPEPENVIQINEG